MDKTTYIGADELCEEALLGRDMSIEKSGDGPDILIYHTHSQEGTVIPLIHQRQRP